MITLNASCYLYDVQKRNCLEKDYFLSVLFLKMRLSCIGWKSYTTFGGTAKYAKTIPLRCKDVVDSIITESGLQLLPKLTASEHKILVDISEFTGYNELYAVANKIDLFDSQIELSFMKLAVHKLCLLYHEEILEDWYRINVYRDLFDLLFNSKRGYRTKRSECHSQTIKTLKANGLVDAEEKGYQVGFYIHKFNWNQRFVFL
ncbi:hypothetical protein BD560DRAFT_389958 [Blakeslea trispora]|nr:hypothetical protein BD560DRAFT_389958 [Blakeslea trispora]